MPALPPVIVIARLTVQEASRRRLLMALVILTLIVVGISAWGFYKISTVAGPNGKPPTHEEVIIVSSQLLIFVTFVYSGVLALSAAVVAGPLISNEVETGLILSILARPVRRSEIVIGKWLGLATLVTIYAVGSAVLEMIAVDWATTYVPPHPVELIVYVGLEGLALLSLGLLLSTRLSGITGGVIALVAWLMAWIGGIVGDIGTGFQNEAVQDVGIVSRLLLPTDGLWRGAINAMEPDVILAQLRSAGAFARANPFAALDPPPVAFLLWVAVWFAGILFLSIWSFRTREI
ncbi:MAG TPA: ABC transporter permease [Candidatus Dormibacteraeota bacterium]|nr:ABC transporter permease [Candidatus Dormibacteraeota bacterium]